MRERIRARSPSLTTVVMVLLLILVLQGGISYTTTFGRLEHIIFGASRDPLSVVWFAGRGLLIGVTIVLWVMNRRQALFRAIVVSNALLTLGLVVNTITLMVALTGSAARDVRALVVDVILMAITNVLIFSIWYWIIDPPGITEDASENAAWDFLFPQRAAVLPHYEGWMPRYTDYLYVAFTTSYAFSPTDTMPLTRRAKLLMLAQSAISIVTLTGIAGGVINLMVGSH